MATQRNKPSTGEIYHIYNRGIEKRRVFMNDKDQETAVTPPGAA